ncbi:hypothetical protein AVEN_46633-1 [Araneus ventricosus]|uniref:Uncharacterized protein n=1 Tax=Araneus ventricosus TaxID=182803 RepID=A0A4Y2L9P2_ARAVE|nr:hypothetical protein AVEN_46633-1 [Araneus ventricosus]
MFSHHCLKRTLFQISVPSISENGNSHWVPNLDCMWVALYFPLELLQEFLTGIVMQEDDTITEHARTFASNGFKKPCESGTRETTFLYVLPFQSLCHV